MVKVGLGRVIIFRTNDFRVVFLMDRLISKAKGIMPGRLGVKASMVLK